MNKTQILDFLIGKKAEYEEEGLIPTLELLIEELEKELNEDVCTEEDINGDFSGASDTLTDFNDR